ncbi:hypothetical protein Pan2_88 [Pseudanabaena phage Pan2]|nr:hypothetical protein Pan2_88 [Pseudanabaena phage Pan2]
MYNVYSIIEGAIDYEASFSDIEEAVYCYTDLLHNERAMQAAGNYPGATVHLFDAHEASTTMLAESTVEASA